MGTTGTGGGGASLGDFAGTASLPAAAAPEAAADMDAGRFDILDSSAQAATERYGLGTTGTGGGGAASDPAAAAKSFDGDFGNKREAKPQVRMKNPDVSGSLDKRIIQKAVRQHVGELRACYEREVAKVNGLNGVLTVVWLITPQGAVTKVNLKSSTMNNKNVEKCVTDSIKFWRFPQPGGGGDVLVEYPFDFQVN